MFRRRYSTARVIDFEKEKQKLIKEEIQKRGFSKLDMEKLYEKENELSQKVQFFLMNMPEYNELVDVRAQIKNKSEIRNEYDSAVIKLSIDEQRKLMDEALRDIALRNIEYCTSYNGDEEKYLKFVERIHGLKDEWKAFRRTNVDNFNYYIAKAKFMLDQYSYNYCVLLVDAYKDYKKYLTLDDRVKFIKGIGAKILQKDIDDLGNVIPADEMFRKIKSKTDREIKHREVLEKKYKKNRYRNLNYDEFMFRLECFRILNDAYEIPELREFAPIINYKYFCGASVVETSRFVYDIEELINLRLKEIKKENKDEGLHTYNEFLDIANQYYDTDNNRSQVNTKLRNLEKALAKYLISREKDYITGLEYFEKFRQVEKDLDEKELMIEFAKTMERYKETTESLKNMTTKLPRKKKQDKKQ